MNSIDTIAGVLLGTAMGDALGLPHEGLSPQRIARRLRRQSLGHRMFFGRGLLSDDTEHTSMVARALAESQGSIDAFANSFARQLRRWILGLPPGVGWATLRGATRSLLGVGPSRSGVRSAGNGPAVRSAILGVCARDDVHLVGLVRASTRITHIDPRAEDGAVLIARLARQLATQKLDPGIVQDIRDVDFRRRVRDAWQVEYHGLEDYRVAAGYQRGVSGFIVHTVPAALYCALRTCSTTEAFERAVRLGGDTDTTAAIVGALVGARTGVEGLPKVWLDGIRDWPLSTESLLALADALANGNAVPRQRWVASIPRNLALVVLIIGHLALRGLGR